MILVAVTSPRPEITTETEKSRGQSTATSTESVEIKNEKSTEEKNEALVTTAPEIEPEFVKETKVEDKGKEEPDSMIEGTTELSKTHKIHFLHELAGTSLLPF